MAPPPAEKLTSGVASPPVAEQLLHLRQTGMSAPPWSYTGLFMGLWHSATGGQVQAAPTVNSQNFFPLCGTSLLVRGEKLHEGGEVGGCVEGEDGVLDLVHAGIGHAGRGE